MADKGKDPLPIFKKSISLTKSNKNIEILWASTREAYNYTQAKQINCDIITMPPKIINQIGSFGKTEVDWRLNRAVFFSRKERETWHSYQGDNKNDRIALVFNLMTLDTVQGFLKDSKKSKFNI